MSKFEESKFYKSLQDFFINNNKDTFLQFIAEFYNRTESIIDKNNIQDELIKELRELYLEFNEKGIDNNIVREKVNYFLENSKKIYDITSQMEHIEREKLDKDGIVTMANMGQDVKKAMSGGAVPYVGENSVNELTFNQDLKKSLCSYKKEELEVLNGYFDSTTNYNRIGTSSHYKSIKKSCMEGERYSCDCSVDTSSLSKVIFYNETGSILSSIGKGENGTFKNFEFTVPDGATSLTITSRISLLSEPVLRKLTINDTNEINGNIEYLTNEVYKFIEEDNEIKNGFYETNKVGFQSNSQYWSIYQSCKEGEKYSASFNLQDSVCAKVIFYDSNNSRVSWIGKGEVGNYTDFEFNIPSGISYFSITSKNTKPSLKKYGNVALEVGKKISPLRKNIDKLNSKYPIYAFVNWNVYYFMWKYDNTRDIIVSLNKVGQSSLYQLSHFYTVANEDKDCSGDFTLPQTQLKTTTSDFVGPYKVLAKNNIDGENITEENIRFTGGWHGFNGNQTGGATGRNISINVYVDGKKMSSTNNTKIGGRKIEVVVVNEINASNTAKSDGTGRNVLQETVTYTFIEGKIDVDVKIKALEDITIKEYYGLQIEAAGYKENVSFISDDTIVSDYKKYTYAGTKQDQICNTIVSNGTDKCIIAEIKADFGIGRRKYVSDTSYTAWASDYGKAYFCLVKGKDLELNKNQCAFWRGCYKIKNRII